MKKFILFLTFSIFILLSPPLQGQNPFYLMTIPKSGTHLIWKTIMMMTGREQAHPGKLFPKLGVFPFPEDVPDVQFDQNLFDHFVLDAWATQRFTMAHLNFAMLFQQFSLSHPDYKPIIFVRDLRDVCISLVHFQWNEIEREIGPSSIQQKLLWVISRGMGPEVGGRILHIGKNAREAALWAKRPGVVVLKYEDLVGPEGGGTKQAQWEALIKLAGALGMQLDSTQLCYLADNIYGKRGMPMSSSTFRQGKTGNWRTYFTGKLDRAFKKSLGQYQTALGYSMD